MPIMSSAEQDSTISKPDPDTASYTTSRRLFLLFFALVFLAGCGTLILSFKAVPKFELLAVFFTFVYVQSANFLQQSSPPTSSSSASSPPSAATSAPLSAKQIRPLAKSEIIGRTTIRLFISTSFILSVIIPWVWLLLFEPSTEQAALLGPHLFLMMTQVLFEIWSYRQTVSYLIRIGIPVGFVAYRLKLLFTWVDQSYTTYQKYAIYNTNFYDNKGFAMLLLSVSNLVFWCFILFYVLLLKVCPPYFIPKKSPQNQQKRQPLKEGLQGSTSSKPN